jgi:hypothetical protein
MVIKVIKLITDKLFNVNKQLAYYIIHLTLLNINHLLFYNIKQLKILQLIVYSLI